MFVVPESDSKKPENRFEFLVGKTKHSVPKLGFICAEAAVLFDQVRNLEGLIACADNEKARNALLKMNSDQIDKLEDAWIAASKVSPGESQGSTDS